jgi:hypothetical protein
MFTLHQENDRLVTAKHKESLQPVHTPEATMKILGSSIRETIRIKSSSGSSFQPDITALSDLPLSLDDTIRVSNQMSRPPVMDFPATIFN